MNKCSGWIRKSHDTSRELIEVDYKGCEYCGGFECDDFPEILYLCPICLREYSEKIKIFNERLIPISQEQIDDNCFTDVEVRN
jgi:hypothetical protein